MSEYNNLRTCSECISFMLSQYFTKNVKGEYFKCCDICKNKKKNNFIPTQATINKARIEYIEEMLKHGEGQIQYIGKANPSDVNFPAEEFPDFNLNEYLLEYHIFRYINTDTQVIMRWRLKFDSNILEPIHFATGPTVIK